LPLLKDDGGIHTGVVGEGGDGSSAPQRGRSLEDGGEQEMTAMQYAMGRKALVSTTAYMMLRLAVIGLDEGLPLFMSTPQLDGGMGFSSNEIGLALFGQGILLVVCVLFLFPYMKERLGTLQLFWLATLCIPVVCLVTPLLGDVIAYVSEPVLWVLVEAYMALKVLAFSTGFTAVSLLINNSGTPDCGHQHHTTPLFITTHDTAHHF